MSAKNMSDEELDNLFRKSAEQHTPPFDPEAWEAMDRRLDDIQGKPSGFKRLLPLLLLALFVSVVFIWRNYQVHRPDFTHVPVSESKDEILQQPGILDNKINLESTALSEPKPGAIQHPGALAGSGRASTEKHLTETRNKYKASESATIKAEGAEPETEVQNLVLPDLVGKGVTAQFENTYNFNPDSLDASLAKTDTANQTNLTESALPADSTRKVVKKTGVFLKSMTVVVAVAPDFTTVRFKNADAVSTNAGLLVTLPLTNRFSIVSGAVWANKLYSAAPQDYEPYADFWNGKTLPDVITAECKVLDIPVNLQYKILEKGKNKLTIETGLSSYIMLNEKYTYTYTHPGSSPYSKTREVENENRHWFGVQNLAVGYARTLSPVLSVGIQPFVKMPLEGIGAGNVKLTSAGVFFTAGYTLKPKN